MKNPILYSFRRCPYAMRARMAIYLADIECELREVYLKNKPSEMLEISPKGTVPVLELNDQVIEESNEIIQWALSKNSKKLMRLNSEQQDFALKTIHEFDTDFKHHLDRYKYYQRHNTDPYLHRDKCNSILLYLEEVIKKNDWITSTQASILFISIMPFIRQYRIADSDYFSSMDHKGVTILLKEFESSALLKEVMQKHEQWSKEKNNGIFVS